MTTSEVEPILVSSALDLLPPRIRERLLSDSVFLTKWGISTVTSVSLGGGGPTFKRDELWNGIRVAIDSLEVAIPVKDVNAATWNVLVQSDGSRLTFSISSEGKQFYVVDHSALASSASMRTAWLQEKAAEEYIDAGTYAKWLARLRASPLGDEEFQELLEDIDSTPVGNYRALRASMMRESSSASALVPNERRYYERLVGSIGAAKTVAQYVETSAAPLMAGLRQWSRKQGFLFSLLLCSSAQISDAVSIDEFSPEELSEIYRWLSEKGDPISCVAAVEIALARLDQRPELAPFLERLIEGLIVEDSDENPGRTYSLSMLIVVIFSEISRRKLFGGLPPFFVRQAAMAQASLVSRAMNESNVDPSSVIEWGSKLGIGYIFFVQGLVDLRREPRWLPEFVEPRQIRAEFVGRLMNAATRNEGKIQTDGLRGLLLGAESKVAKSVRWPSPSFPGPMEGAVSPRQKMPEDLLTEIGSDFESGPLRAETFNILANAALLFDLPESYPSRVASALRRVNYSVDNADDGSAVLRLLSNVSTVVAMTRGVELAIELRILMRVLRRKGRGGVSSSDEMRIALVASASVEDLTEWAKTAGEWLTEICFECKDRSDAQSLLHQIRYLIQVEPTLTRYCSAGEASLVLLSQ